MPLPIGGNKQESVSIKNDTKSCGVGGHGHCSHFGKKIIITLVGVLLVYSVFYLGTLMRNNIKKYDFIGKADKMERTVTVVGFGKVTGNNDIALTSIGHSNTDKDVAKAQAENKKVMDQVFAELTKMGIVDKDLQSNYTIYPDYNYTEGKGQELKGYRVSHSLSIKIRDLSKISAVLGLAGKYGATEVGGLSFTIDDPENLKAEARDKALLDAKVKAARLSNALRMRLGGIVSYNEYEGGDYQPRAMYMESSMGGMGGPAAISGGSKDVNMNVNITFEVLQ